MKRWINRFRMTGSVSSSGKTPAALGEEVTRQARQWGCGWQLGIAIALGMGGVLLCIQRTNFNVSPLKSRRGVGGEVIFSLV